MVSPAVRVLKKRKGGHFDRRKMDWATMVKKYGLGIKRRSFRAILESDFRSPVPAPPPARGGSERVPGSHGTL